MTTSALPKPPLSRAYTLKASKIPNYFTVLFDNPPPEVFDAAFLAKSGFRYAIDRTFIDILKGLGFLTEADVPTQRYVDFRGRRQAGAVLRQGLAEAYAGLLSALPQAAACPERQIMETVSRYFEGEINDMAASGIAATFLALTRYAASLDNGSAIAGAAHRPTVATIPASEPAAPAPVARDLATGTASKPVSAAQPVPEPATASQPVAAPEPVAAVSAAFAVASVDAPKPVGAQAEVASPHAAPEAVDQTEAVTPTNAEAPAPATAMAAVAETAAPEPAPAASPEAAVSMSPVAGPDTAVKTDCAPGITLAAFSSEAQGQESPQRPVVHITLPASTDQAVYDAIFASLKRHMLPSGDNA